VVNKKQFGKFQSGIVVFGIIVIALVIALSLFGDASGAFHLIQQPSTPPPEPSITIPEPFDNRGEIPQSNIFEIISTLMNIPFQALMTIVVLIVAVIIAIPIILIVRRGKKK